jgi:anti-sigma factor RsiW
MLSERDIEAAHPDAFDFVFGNLPSAKRADFNLHLTECRYCQAVVDEYSEIGGIIKQLPPHVNPPAELEDRIVGAMVAGLAGTENHERPVDAEDHSATRVYPVVTRLPVWRRSRGLLAAVAAVAAAIIIAALLVIPNLGGGRLNPAQATVVTPLQATTAAKLKGDGAATGQATAHQAGPSWTFTMTVHGLKVLPDNDVYECWWVGRDSSKAHPQFVSGGTFIVDKSGSATVTMTTGIDPHDFPTMEVTMESPGTGALSGVVILSGRTL